MKDMGENMSLLQKNKYIYIVGICALVAILGIFFFYNKNMQSKLTKKDTSSMESQPSVSPQNKTRLTLVGNTSKLKVGKQELYKVELTDLPVAAVDIVLKYDPTLIEVTSVKAGTAFPQVIKNTIDKVKGQILFSSAIPTSNTTGSAQGEILSFMIKPLKSITKASIDFDTQNTITALNGENTLSSAKGIILEIIK
ncbi:MAG: cohesin domain-containing protein [Candidatus Roizmanbacteria bacterium]